MIGANFESNREEILRELERLSEDALEAVGLKMEANIKNNITQMRAVDTGRLRGSITYATNTSHSTGQSPAVSEDFATLSTPPEGTVCAGTNVEYAEFVERGWSKAAARPFLQKGVTEHMKEYTDIIEEYLKS
jgi:hypothetical protein